MMLTRKFDVWCSLSKTLDGIWGNELFGSSSRGDGGLVKSNARCSSGCEGWLGHSPPWVAAARRESEWGPGSLEQ